MIDRVSFVGIGLLALAAALLAAWGCDGGKSQVLNIAHRGASGLAPENTLAAFRKAVDIGADFVEFDVQLSKDGSVIILHDLTLDRTTDGTGAPGDYSLQELKQLDAGSSFSAEFKGEPLPTLDETLGYLKGKIKADIEIKVSTFNPVLVQKVIDLVRNHDFGRSCILTSFDHASIEEVKRLAPELKTGFIINQLYDGMEFKGNWDYVVAKHTLVDEKFIQKAKEAKMIVYAYTVNDEETMKRLIGVGVAGIITNFPDRLKAVLALSGTAK